MGKPVDAANWIGRLDCMGGDCCTARGGEYAVNQVWKGATPSGTRELSILISVAGPNVSQTKFRARLLNKDKDACGLLECAQIDNPEETLDCFQITDVMRSENEFTQFKNGQVKTKSKSSDSWVVVIEPNNHGAVGGALDPFKLSLVSDEAEAKAMKEEINDMQE